MKKMRSILAIVLVLLMVLGLAGCSGQSQQPTETPTEDTAPKEEVSAADAKEDETSADKKVVIGVTMADVTSPSIVLMLNAMQEKAEEMNAELKIVDYKSDISTLIESVENFVSANVDCIVAQTMDTGSGTDALRAAKEAGITVIAFDTALEDNVMDYFFGASNYELGKTIGTAAGTWAKDNITGPVKVGVCNAPSIAFAVERSNGIIDGVKEACPDAEVVMEAECYMTPVGVETGENFLNANPDMNLVVGINDGGVLGVYEAFKAAGKSGNKEIGIFGGDGTPDGFDSVAAGDIFRGTVSLELDKIGMQMVEYAVNTAQGNPPEETTVYFPMIPVNGDNVSDFTK